MHITFNRVAAAGPAAARPGTWPGRAADGSVPLAIRHFRGHPGPSMASRIGRNRQEGQKASHGPAAPGIANGAPGGAPSRTNTPTRLPSVHLLCHGRRIRPCASLVNSAHSGRYSPAMARLPRLVARGCLAAVPGPSSVLPLYWSRAPLERPERDRFVISIDRGCLMPQAGRPAQDCQPPRSAGR
jgi:hypothetical protein